MSVTLGPLNNVNLLEHRLSSEEYNALPRIDDCKLEPLKHRDAHSALLNLIAGHGLSDKFSIHLVHKHFDVPQDQVMVYEKVRGGKTPDFVIMTPRDPKNQKLAAPLRGIYFLATPDDKMQAYEYTTEAAADLSAHADFVKAYATLANRLGVGRIFALGAEGIATLDTPLAEFEMGPYLSTVLVEAESLPGLEEMSSTGTDWRPAPAAATTTKSANEDGKPQEKALAGTGAAGGTIYPEIQGLITSHCIEDRKGCHNYHGKKATPVTEGASLSGTGAAGGTIYPEIQGLITSHCIEDRKGSHNYHGKKATPPVVDGASLSGTGAAGGTIYPEIQGLITSHCIEDRKGSHNYHGKKATPSVMEAAPLSGTGAAGGTIYPELKGLITSHCIEDRKGCHNYHGKKATPPVTEGDFLVETRQSMAGMSNKAGTQEVEVHPGIRVGDLPVIKDSVIHDVLDRAVAAIKAC